MIDNGHILVVDDQPEVCDIVQEYLTGEGYRVSSAHDGVGMRRVITQSPVDLDALTDRSPVGVSFSGHAPGTTSRGHGFAITP